MRATIDPSERAKLTAAYHALGTIEDGMRVGLGTGSTASWLVKLLGARRDIEDLDLVCVATSEATEALARAVGLRTATLEEAEWLDITIDGADEFDPNLSLIKGGGGALLREKIVATASERMVVIADPSKQVETLGRFPLPVEIVRFGWKSTSTLIEDVLEDSDVDSTRIDLRLRHGEPFVSDEGHYILDLELGRIGEVESLESSLRAVPGVVETGLFVDIADTVFLGYPSGEASVISLEDGTEPIDTTDEPQLNELLARIGND
jgi:ribose 5-phosphate isomerase A